MFLDLAGKFPIDNLFLGPEVPVVRLICEKSLMGHFQLFKEPIRLLCNPGLSLQDPFLVYRFSTAYVTQVILFIRFRKRSVNIYKLIRPPKLLNHLTRQLITWIVINTLEIPLQIFPLQILLENHIRDEGAYVGIKFVIHHF